MRGEATCSRIEKRQASGEWKSKGKTGFRYKACTPRCSMCFLFFSSATISREYRDQLFTSQTCQPRLVSVSEVFQRKSRPRQLLRLSVDSGRLNPGVTWVGVEESGREALNSASARNQSLTNKSPRDLLNSCEYRALPWGISPPPVATIITAISCNRFYNFFFLF